MKADFKKKGILFVFALIFYFIVSALINAGTLDAYYSQILILICINVILALSLNLIVGFTGQLALGHAGFMSIGAYTASFLSIKFNLPFLLVLILGGGLSAFIGFLIGLPTLRLKGDYLAITTLGFGEIIRVVIVNIDSVGGASGLAGIPNKTDFTWTFFIMLLTIMVIYNIIKSSQGRAMISIREDEIASESMGINTTKYKLIAFVIGAFFAGVAGGLYAHYLMFIEPTSFSFLKSVEIVTFVVLGGMGSILGSIISTTVLTILPEALRQFADLRMVIYPLLLIIIMLVRGNKGKLLTITGKVFKKNRGDKDVAA